MGVGKSLDQAVEAQPPQIVGEPAWGELAGIKAQQERDVVAQVSIGESPWQETEQDEGAEQGLVQDSGSHYAVRLACCKGDCACLTAQGLAKPRTSVKLRLVGRLKLTDAKGNPRCASVRPPDVQWEVSSR